MRALFIIDNGNGTIHIERDPSWNTPENKPNQLAKFNVDEDVLPVEPVGVPEKYWAWDGTQIVECDQAAKDAIAADEQAADDAETERKNTPLVFDQPLETPALVLQSHEAEIGVGVIADDDGALLTFAYHASPIPSPSEIKARKDAAKAKRSAAKAVVIDKGVEFRNANASANNVPAMRAALVILQEQMAAIQELIGVTDGAVVTP